MEKEVKRDLVIGLLIVVVYGIAGTCFGASVSNPFGYPVFEDLVDGGLRTKFFFPHQTTAAPWWQGDNARVASISVAARMVASVTDDRTLRSDAVRLAEDCIDWILGQNPYDACMVEGYGRNNIAYFFKNRYDFIAALVAHSFSWTFMVMLPIAVTSYTLSGLFYVVFIINVIIHAVTDNAKANEKRISLAADQLIHVGQVVGTFVVLQIWH